MLGSYKEDGFLGGSEPDPRASTTSLYIAVRDPDLLHARTTRVGAEAVRELTDTTSTRASVSVRHLEDNLWSLGTYNPYDR
jgi:hypothetical protein